ncbi:Mu transposase C-terminal domain-containing protein [Crenobacter sp. SG2303]|uniref:Mu transposase C-terminal domain-containing protein n=1 Tax=Crenobacter oryzisoli TaxID=3056844 RepID=A0ABT7XNQ0_9NEIS|nr:Mu transposase C-terminal domain-containing protein [Crenobacter sp. SG2303]MDN0075417.1 Mu transposase C-terminal domain-containing protein [Crenobacter sp. SG2303]
MLFLNDVLEHKASGAKLRVIHANYAAEEIWLYNLGDDLAFPKMYDLHEIEAEVAEGKLVLFEGQKSNQVIAPSAAAICQRDKAYLRIKPLLANLDIFAPSERNRMVEIRAAEIGCAKQTLYEDLRNWWRNGQNPNALLPKFDKRGSKGGTTANRGRRPKYLNYQIYQITEEDQRIFKAALENLFLKNDLMTLRACYQRVLENRYSYVDGEGESCLKAVGEYPSEQQFRYFAKKILPAETVIRKRKGDAVFELEHRPKLGSLQHQTYTVGDAYEIDATIADVLLVSRRNRATIIGKPTLYLVFDRKSWLIVGFYVGLEAPSWPAAMQAIKSISEDKAELCLRYGVPYNSADWPAHGVYPKEFIADRGELLSTNSDLLVEGLNIVVRNLPAQRADHKPLVECGFKLLQRAMADSVPGYIPPESFGKRQGKHYDQDACLNLDEFTTIILQSIIRFNRSPRENYIWPAENVMNGLQPIPLDIWHLEIRRRAGALARIPEMQVRFALLPKMKATVTREGIRLGACYYSCPEALQRGWMVAANRGEFPVDVTYDRRQVDTIYVHDKQHANQFFVATLLDRCSDYRGLSFMEVEAIEFHREALRQKGEHITRENLLQFHQKIDPLTRQAKAEMRQAAKGRTRSARKKDIVKDRENERREQRQQEACLPGTTSPERPLPQGTAFPPLPPTKQSSDVMHNLSTDRDARRRQKYLEMLNGN